MYMPDAKAIGIGTHVPPVKAIVVSTTLVVVVVVAES
jgi:hypothetical protein